MYREVAISRFKKILNDIFVDIMGKNAFKSL